MYTPARPLLVKLTIASDNIVTSSVLSFVVAVSPDIKLLPSAGSDRAWVYTVNADFADEEAKVEQLAIRFKNAESKSWNIFLVDTSI